MYSKSSGLKSAAGRRRKQKRRKLFLIGAAVLLLLLIAGVVFLAHLKEIRIARVYSEGNSLVSDEEVRALVRGEIAGNDLLVFPRNNIFYYPQGAIEKKFLDTYPAIKKVNVSFRDFQSITVRITERAPRALWCEGDSTDAPCFLIDDEGMVFQTADGTSTADFIRFSGGITGDPIRIHVDTPERFASMHSFAERLKGAGFVVTSINLRPDGVREGMTDAGQKVIWSEDEDLSLGLENLKTLIADQAFLSESGGVVNIEYFDIQNSNKIFYKIKATTTSSKQ